MKYDITLKKKIFKNICEFLKTKDGLKCKRKDLIKQLTGDFSLAAVDFVIQELVAKERLVVCGKSRTEVLRLRKKEITASLKKLPREDRSVYAAIENTEAKGIWVQLIQRQTQLPKVRIDKAIKNLEREDLIARVIPPGRSKSTRKIYICKEHFQMNSAVAMDSGFFQRVRDDIQTIVSRSGEDGVTVPKIYEQMKSKKNLLRLGTKEAKISDVEDCVFALICDSNLIPVADSEPHEVALTGKRSASTMEASGTRVKTFENNIASHYTNIPCVACPVKDLCHPGGDINPENCKYLDKWLGLEVPV